MFRSNKKKEGKNNDKKGLKGKTKKDDKRKVSVKESKGVRFSTKGRRSRSIAEYEGTVSIARDGFGFVTVEGLESDIFVTQQHLRGALNGDFVKVAVRKQREGSRRTEGEIVKIIERSRKPHIGILMVKGKNVWAIVESRTMPYDIKIPINSLDELPTIGGIKAASGVKVAVVVTEWPRGSVEPFGKIVDVLGEPGENDAEMHAILAEYMLPYRFEPEVVEAAEKISETITEEEIAARRDFRNVTTFTIDPTDAKDFDDALSFRKLDNGHYEVGVHIADVSYYVQPGDIVDKEAYNRATSVYLVDRTVPMLPENLSNKLCSLRPGEDKLCFSTVFEMDDSAKVHDIWFGRTIINSDCRFDYEEAQQVIETGEGRLNEEIGILHKIATILRTKRFDSGAVNFERPEMKVLVDETGKPVEVLQKISRESNFLIEEFMLLANRSVAEFVTRKCGMRKPTFVYRIHELPNQEKLGALRSFAHNFGHKLGATETSRQTSKSLNKLLTSVKGTAEESAIEMLALRSMARARYSTENVGHYGLAFRYYTHFTSPIRRYPDLMVHRLLALYLNGAKSQNREEYEEKCKYSSEREQVATDAERSSIKYKLVEFMQDKVGQVFEGTVSGLTEWGMYVEIEPTKIEGMVPLREIRTDFFSFDADTYKIVGKATGRSYTLGSKVKVRVVRASLEQKLLDYELVEE